MEPRWQWFWSYVVGAMTWFICSDVLVTYTVTVVAFFPFNSMPRPKWYLKASRKKAQKTGQWVHDKADTRLHTNCLQNCLEVEYTKRMKTYLTEHDRKMNLQLKQMMSNGQPVRKAGVHIRWLSVGMACGSSPTFVVPILKMCTLMTKIYYNSIVTLVVSSSFFCLLY